MYSITQKLASPNDFFHLFYFLNFNPSTYLFNGKLLVAPIISVFQVVTFLAIPANVFFKKWVNPGLFFIYFRLFQTHITSCSTNKCEKCPSSIWCQYLKSRPLEHEFLQPLDQGFISCLRFKLQKVDIRKIDPIH